MWALVVVMKVPPSLWLVLSGIIDALFIVLTGTELGYVFLGIPIVNHSLKCIVWILRTILFSLMHHCFDGPSKTFASDSSSNHAGLRDPTQESVERTIGVQDDIEIICSLFEQGRIVCKIVRKEKTSALFEDSAPEVRGIDNSTRVCSL